MELIACALGYILYIIFGGTMWLAILGGIGGYHFLKEASRGRFAIDWTTVEDKDKSITRLDVLILIFIVISFFSSCVGIGGMICDINAYIEIAHANVQYIAPKLATILWFALPAIGSFILARVLFDLYYRFAPLIAKLEETHDNEVEAPSK